MTHYAEFIEEKNGVEITWRTRYEWSTLRPATHESPAEGGLELDGDPFPVTVSYYPRMGIEQLTIDNIQEGSILGILLTERHDTPHEDNFWEAAGVHNNERLQDPRW